MFYLSFSNFQTRIDGVIPITKKNNRLQTLRVNLIDLEAGSYEIKRQLYNEAKRLKNELEIRIVEARRSHQGRVYKYLPKMLIFKLFKNNGQNKFELICDVKIDRVTGELL